MKGRKRNKEKNQRYISVPSFRLRANPHPTGSVYKRDWRLERMKLIEKGVSMERVWI